MDFKAKEETKSKVANIYLMHYFPNNVSMQITHIKDFQYWKIYDGFTIDEIKERKLTFDYPPRFQIQCEQIDASKSLFSSFVLSKRNRNKEEEEIAEFSLIKKVTGTIVTYTCIF